VAHEKQLPPSLETEIKTFCRLTNLSYDRVHARIEEILSSPKSVGELAMGMKRIAATYDDLIDAVMSDIQRIEREPLSMNTHRRLAILRRQFRSLMRAHPLPEHSRYAEKK